MNAQKNTNNKYQNIRYSLKWGNKSIANCSHNELIDCIIHAYQQMAVLAGQNQAMMKVLTEHDMIQEVEIGNPENGSNGSKITEESNGKENSEPAPTPEAG